ncbi:MAG: OsmC family protein [Bradymonadaceae bacterium]|nr:OsmC family protein [Lujinxingiaceae bacterium]
MVDLKRSAQAVWKGDLKTGNGTSSTKSDAFKDLPYSFATRFENQPGTNPEELIAAAHASCFSMALANILASDGHTPESIHTVAQVTLRKGDAGFKVVAVHLQTEGNVPGIDAAAFQEAAQKAKEKCPISVLLKPGLEELSVEATLL